MIFQRPQTTEPSGEVFSWEVDLLPEESINNIDDWFASDVFFLDKECVREVDGNLVAVKLYTTVDNRCFLHLYFMSNGKLRIETDMAPWALIRNSELAEGTEGYKKLIKHIRESVKQSFEALSYIKDRTGQIKVFFEYLDSSETSKELACKVKRRDSTTFEVGRVFLKSDNIRIDFKSSLLTEEGFRRQLKDFLEGENND